ncbi:MAG: DUF1499 domain-containing protein [Gemmatimonadota bacterium]
MSRSLVDAITRGLTRNVAFTSPGARDPRLRGRTYAIPFEDVWQASTALVAGGLKRWEVLEADDQEGTIRGMARGRIERTTSAITIRITLDDDAQTRVDALSASHVGRADFGRNARRLQHFFAALDRQLEDRRGKSIERLTIEPTTAPTPS